MATATLMMRFLAALSISAAAAHAAVIAANSSRGAQLFESLHCIECHSINGAGGEVGPDLGRLIDRSFTPALLAATMWNHAPTMWQAMKAQNIQAGDLPPQAAADLFAFFYSRGFFNRPGDAARGKRDFAALHCADCHGLTQPKLPAAKPVSEWQTLEHPIALADAMWNHAVNMREEFQKRNIAWPELTSQELTDILVYLRHLPATRGVTPHFEISAGENGEEFFQSKGCAACHAGTLALESRIKGMTLIDIAVAMWNHAPKMAPQPPTLDLEQMRSILSFLWARQFFEDSGNSGAGEKVFVSKNCVECHNNPASGAPHLPAPGQSFNGATMVSALWGHGPRMMQQMQAQHVPWPRFESAEMSNLVAYLNSAK